MLELKKRPAGRSIWQWALRSHLLAGGVALLLLLSVAATGAKEPWEIEWEQTVAKGQQEGNVTIILRAGRWKSVFDVFEKKFGIKAKLIGGDSTSQLNRALAERRAGRYTIDLVSMGDRLVRTILLPKNMAKPIRPELILPEVKDPSKWYQGRLWGGRADPEAKYNLQFAAGADVADNFAVANTNNVTQKEINAINSVWDLLNPRFKGKIVARPPGGGTSGPWGYGANHPDIGIKWFERFYREMEPTFIQDRRLIVDQIVLGAFDIGMMLTGGTRSVAIRVGMQGGPVVSIGLKNEENWKERAMLDYGSSQRSISIMDRAPHPNAARVLVNWLLSKEGQTTMHTHFLLREPYPTLREDVTEMGRVALKDRRKPGKKYLIVAHLPEYDIEKTSARILALHQEYISQRRGRKR